MNERIKELAIQTDIWCDQNLAQGSPMYNNQWEQKFAELIVFECVNAVMDGTKEGDHYAQRIEQHFDKGTGGVLHFGVEE